MDVMKEFKKYLPIWSEQKMQPIPTEEHPDRWAIAWKDFINEYMPSKYNQMVEEYKNMKLKTYGMAKKEKLLKEIEPEVEEEIKEEPIIEVSEKLTEWDKIKKLMEE